MATGRLKSRRADGPGGRPNGEVPMVDEESIQRLIRLHPLLRIARWHLDQIETTQSTTPELASLVVDHANVELPVSHVPLADFRAASGLDRSAQALSPLSRARADGARARHEPQEARQARQPPAGTLEAASPGIHRAPVLQTVRQEPPGRRCLHRGAGPQGGRQAGVEARDEASARQ